MLGGCNIYQNLCYYYSINFMFFLLLFRRLFFWLAFSAAARFLTCCETGKTGITGNGKKVEWKKLGLQSINGNGCGL